MKIGRLWKVAAFGGTLAGSAALIAAASGATGAFFNDTHSGTLTGNVGSILVATSNLTLDMQNMLPGTWNTKTVHYVNNGANAQDVWVVFTNKTALHALNNMGQYGQVTIKNTGTRKFYSINLSDGETAAGGPITQAGGHCTSTKAAAAATDVALTTNESGSTPGCWPLKNAIELASNVTPGQGGTMTFSFAMGPKFKGSALEGQPFFCYPLVQNGSNQETQTCTGANHGLPYEIVATQPGIAPTNPLNTTPTP